MPPIATIFLILLLLPPNMRLLPGGSNGRGLGWTIVSRGRSFNNKHTHTHTHTYAHRTHTRTPHTHHTQACTHTPHKHSQKHTHTEILMRLFLFFASSRCVLEGRRYLALSRLSCVCVCMCVCVFTENMGDPVARCSENGQHEIGQSKPIGPKVYYSISWLGKILYSVR